MTAEATAKLNKVSIDTAGCSSVAIAKFDPDVQDMRDLEDIFAELATIVHEQHETVDSIEVSLLVCLRLDSVFWRFMQTFVSWSCFHFISIFRSTSNELRMTFVVEMSSWRRLFDRKRTGYVAAAYNACVFAARQLLWSFVGLKFALFATFLCHPSNLSLVLGLVVNHGGLDLVLLCHTGLS